MPASAAVNGFGTTFSYESAPSTYTALGEVMSVTPPTFSRETIDATHMASDDTFREYIGGVFDGGEVTVNMNYVEAQATLCQTLLLAGVESFRIVIPGASTIVFSGIPTGYAVGELVIDDKVTHSLTIKVTGKPIYTAV